MNKQKLVITSVLIAAAISMITLASLPLDDKYVYTQSDITKANPNLKIGNTIVSMSHDIEYVKQYVDLTVSGKVVSVGDPIPWTDESGTVHGAIPITIEVDKKSKDKTSKLKLKKGDLFTFNIDSLYHDGEFYIWQHEAQFELDEKTLVHITNAEEGPNGVDGDNYSTILGKYGKYKVVGDKAYNEEHKNGKSLDKTFNEAN